MDRAELEAGARGILLGNLRQGRADWNGKEYTFVCPALRSYPFQWFWDSCFHAIALIHLDVELARAELTTLLSAALPSGFIPHLIFWETDKRDDFLSRNLVGRTSEYYSATIQPPILAYAVERVYQATGDEAFLAAALPTLKSYYRWLKENRDPDDDGLIAIHQPEESGVDCSPKYDEALHLEELTNQGFIRELRKVYEAYEPMRGDDRRILAADIFHVEDVLVNSIYAFGLRSLARLLAGREDNGEFLAQADRTVEALISKCWDEEAGAFFDLSGVARAPRQGRHHQLPFPPDPGRPSPGDRAQAGGGPADIPGPLLATLSGAIGVRLGAQVHARQSLGLHLARPHLDELQLVPGPRPGPPRLSRSGQADRGEKPPSD